MSLASRADKLSLLQDRALMLKKGRAFFEALNIMEVDCPALTEFPSLDAYIDPIVAVGGYLHTSPEYAMKRLLAKGCQDIYQMGHVYRLGEKGERHNPEFTLVEWYRLGMTFDQMIRETAQFIALFLGEKPLEILTYRDAFLQYAQVDPISINDDEKLNLILANEVEPHLGKGKLTALTHYPATQSALAKTEGQTSLRFEIYFEGVELANGYDELNDSEEQRRRFKTANLKRIANGKGALPLDEPFIESLDTLPDCCGAAIGFDRLMMLRHGISSIHDVLPL